MMVEIGSDQERLVEISRRKGNVDQFIRRWFHDEHGLFSAVYHQFANTSDFEDQLEQHLRRLFDEIRRVNGDVRTAVPQAVEWNLQHPPPRHGPTPGRKSARHRMLVSGSHRAAGKPYRRRRSHRDGWGRVAVEENREGKLSLLIAEGEAVPGPALHLGGTLEHVARPLKISATRVYQLPFIGS